MKEESRQTVFKELAIPARFWSRSEALSQPSPVPAQPGVYAWYFKETPPGVPTNDCITNQGLDLLYAGISPKAAPKDSARPSKQNLRKRIRTHYQGNASGSTLRLSLGCLLADHLGIQLRRHGESERMHFGDGERVLSAWMEDNAFVVWVEHPTPWDEEDAVICRLSPPLNLDKNETHPFHSELTRIRRGAKALAKSLPVLFV